MSPPSRRAGLDEGHQLALVVGGAARRGSPGPWGCPRSRGRTGRGPRGSADRPAARRNGRRTAGAGPPSPPWPTTIGWPGVSAASGVEAERVQIGHQPVGGAVALGLDRPGRSRSRGCAAARTAARGRRRDRRRDGSRTASRDMGCLLVCGSGATLSARHWPGADAEWPAVAATGAPACLRSEHREQGRRTCRHARHRVESARMRIRARLPRPSLALPLRRRTLPNLREARNLVFARAAARSSGRSCPHDEPDRPPTCDAGTDQPDPAAALLRRHRGIRPDEGLLSERDCKAAVELPQHRGGARAAAHGRLRAPAASWSGDPARGLAAGSRAAAVGRGQRRAASVSPADAARAPCAISPATGQWGVGKAVRPRSRPAARRDCRAVGRGLARLAALDRRSRSRRAAIVTWSSRAAQH